MWLTLKIRSLNILDLLRATRYGPKRISKADFDRIGWTFFTSVITRKKPRTFPNYFHCHHVLKISLNLLHTSLSLSSTLTRVSSSSPYPLQLILMYHYLQHLDHHTLSPLKGVSDTWEEWATAHGPQFQGAPPIFYFLTL